MRTGWAGLSGRPTLGCGLEKCGAGVEEIPYRNSQGKTFQAK